MCLPIVQESRKQPQGDKLAVILKCLSFAGHGMRVNVTNFALGNILYFKTIFSSSQYKMSLCEDQVSSASHF